LESVIHTVILFIVTGIGLIGAAITIIESILKNKNNFNDDFSFKPIANEKREVIVFKNSNKYIEGTFEYAIEQFRLERLKIKVLLSTDNDGWLFIYNPYGSMLVGKTYISSLIGVIIFSCMMIFMVYSFTLLESKAFEAILVQIGVILLVLFLSVFFSYYAYNQYKLFVLSKKYFTFLKSNKIRIGREFTRILD